MLVFSTAIVRAGFPVYRLLPLHDPVVPRLLLSESASGRDYRSSRRGECESWRRLKIFCTTDHQLGF